LLSSLTKSLFALAGIDPRIAYQWLSAMSIDAAIKEQGLRKTAEKLREVVPDLTDQYTVDFDPAEYRRYWERKMRGLHAFQTSCLGDAIELLERDLLVIVDIGDSSGHHARYIKAMTDPARIARVISVNLDPVAVDKIRNGGGDAILSSAEDFTSAGIEADLVVSFETVEHLTDPLRFLHQLAQHGGVEHLMMTVPYRRTSRFGGNLLRDEQDRMPATLTPEDVHFFELSQGDWTLLARFAGFVPVFARVYRQYPKFGPLRLTAPLWRRLDFEGFLCLFLRRDLSLADRYSGW